MKRVEPNRGECSLSVSLLPNHNSSSTTTSAFSKAMAESLSKSRANERAPSPKKAKSFHVSSSSTSSASRISQRPSAKSASLTRRGSGTIAQKSVDIEAYSNFRLKNRLVPAEALDKLMTGRAFIPLTRIASSAITSSSTSEVEGGGGGASIDIPGDWVTIAIVTARGTTKIARSTEQYSTLRLFDLKGFSINLFLFGGLCESVGTKVKVGDILGFLNPKIKLPLETKGAIALSLDHRDKLLKIGESLDLAFCRGITSQGSPCSCPIDGRVSGYCQPHEVRNYTMAKQNRAEMTSGTSGISFMRPIVTKGATKTSAASYGGTYEFGRGIVISSHEKQSSGFDKKSSIQSAEEIEQIRQLSMQQTNGGRHFRALQARQGKLPPAKPTNPTLAVSQSFLLNKAALSPGSKVKRSSIFGPSALKKMGFDPITGQDFIVPLEKKKSASVGTEHVSNDEDLIHLDCDD